MAATKPGDGSTADTHPAPSTAASGIVSGPGPAPDVEGAFIGRDAGRRHQRASQVLAVATDVPVIRFARRGLAIAASVA